MNAMYEILYVTLSTKDVACRQFFFGWQILVVAYNIQCLIRTGRELNKILFSKRTH